MWSNAVEVRAFLRPAILAQMITIIN